MQRVFRGLVITVLAATLAVLPANAGELDPDPQAKIGPPVGAPAAASEPSLFDLFWMWLEAQAKIRPPVG